MRCRLDETEGEALRLWNDLAISRVKSHLPRFANDFGLHINMHIKGTFTHGI